MARPKKNHCEYFPHDKDMRNHKKIKSLRNKFGIIGYAIWSMILEYLTGGDGNEFENSEMEFELMSGDFGVSVTEISDVVNYCIKLELLFDKNGFIHSPSLDDNLAPVYEKRHQAKELSAKQLRKKGKFVTNNADVTVVSVTEMPQNKVEYSKEENKDINTNSPFAIFQRWISNNAPKVMKMEQPFTESEFIKLINDYEHTDIQKLLINMHNYKYLVKKNVSANLTFRNWAERNNIIKKNTPKKANV